MNFDASIALTAERGHGCFWGIAKKKSHMKKVGILYILCKVHTDLFFWRHNADLGEERQPLHAVVWRSAGHLRSPMLVAQRLAHVRRMRAAASAPLLSSRGSGENFAWENICQNAGIDAEDNHTGCSRRLRDILVAPPSCCTSHAFLPPMRPTAVLDSTRMILGFWSCLLRLLLTARRGRHRTPASIQGLLPKTRR
jgi:hypothetical protein